MATDNHTGLVRPANRRTVMKALTAGAAAAVAAPVAAHAAQAAPGADAALIALCDRFVEVRRAEHALIVGAHTVEDEKRIEPELDALNAEWWRVTKQIEEIDEIKTPAGARAAALAALAFADRTSDGSYVANDVGESLYLSIAEYLTGGKDPLA